MTLDPIQLTRRLIDIESITYNEGAVGRYLAEFLAGRHFAVETTPVEHAESKGERFNVYAGTAGQTPDVVLSTHMDTVPPFIPSSEDEGYIYGRGACDAKGIIATQIAAAERLREEGVKVGLLFVVGEERDSGGAKLANTQPKGNRFLINGEPTDNRLAIASKGALRVLIRAKGKMAHSAYPELGESAIHKLVEALDRVLAIPLPVMEDVGPGNLNIGLIGGGARHECDSRSCRSADAGTSGWPVRTGAQGDSGCGWRSGGSSLHAGSSVHAHAAAGWTADNGGRIHNGHSCIVELGRAGVAGAGIDPRSAHAA